MRTLHKLPVVAALIELGTGAVLLADPTIIARLLLGAEIAGVGIVLGRCFGIALVALAVACWPSRDPAASSRSSFRAMLIYNVLIAAYLAWLGIAAHMAALLLWPAVILHAGMALLLAWTQRGAAASGRTAT